MWLRASLVAQMVKNLPAMQESQVWFLGREDPLEKGMTTHSSVLTWEIPRTEEPGGLQSIGSQRVGHAWVTNTGQGGYLFSWYNVKLMTSVVQNCCTLQQVHWSWWVYDTMLVKIFCVYWEKKQTMMFLSAPQETQGTDSSAHGGMKKQAYWTVAPKARL